MSTGESYKRKSGQGLYRAEISDIGARYARVMYRTKGEFDVSEQQYRAEGHKPDFDDLPSGKNTTQRIGREQNTPGGRKPGPDETRIALPAPFSF